MLYIDKNDNIYLEKPNNTEVSEMMTVAEASEKWEVERSWARRIVSQVPGAQQRVIKGKNTWIMPANSEKPTKDIHRAKKY